MQLPSSWDFQLGDRVSTWCGFYWHRGIVSGFSFDGQPLVTSASKRRMAVAEDPLAEFSGGRPAWNDGFHGLVPRREVAARLRAMIGQPWHLFRNCEHVASVAEGRTPTSPQLVGWGIAGLLLFALTRESA